MLPYDKTVLVADDSPDDRRLLAEAYKDAGIRNRLVVVTDGAQALDYLNGIGEFGDRARHPMPGLVILDIKMPNMTGLEALQRIRGTSQWALVPVIMLTASGAPEDIADAYRFGAYAYLVKPSSFPELSELVAAIRIFWLRFNEYSPAAS